MNDEKNLKEQFNILFEDLDQEAEEKAPSPVQKDEKVKEFFSDAFEDAKEKTEEFQFDGFEEDEAPTPAPGKYEKKKEERKTFSEEEERTRRKIYEMGRDEDDEFPSFESSEKEKKSDASGKGVLKKELKRFWIFTAVIALLTLAAILFILFSRGILGGKPKENDPTETEQNVTEPSGSADPSETVPDSTETEPTETESESESESEAPVPEDAGLAEILKKYPNFFMVDADKVSSELRVRSDPDTTKDNVVAKLSRTAGGNVDATEGEWLKITSGSFSGYVKAEFCLTGNAAKKAIIPLIKKQVEVKETAKIREGAEKADTGERAAAGAVYDLLGEDGDYYRISYNGTEKFIAKSVVNVKCSIDEASAP